MVPPVTVETLKTNRFLAYWISLSAVDLRGTTDRGRDFGHTYNGSHITGYIQMTALQSVKIPAWPDSDMQHCPLGRRV